MRSTDASSDFHRFVVIEFPTLEQGVACFESPEYHQHAAAFTRDGGGVVENVMVDGVDATPCAGDGANTSFAPCVLIE